MLPRGLTAQPADRDVHRQLAALHPAAQTVVRLLVGACSCDLVRPRHDDPREDERHHRAHRRRSGTPRETLLADLERHRRGAGVPRPAGGWPRALAAFVAEHARNAGDSLYLLTAMGGDAASGLTPGPIHRARVADVVARPEGWLLERSPVMVGR